MQFKFSAVVFLAGLIGAQGSAITPRDTFSRQEKESAHVFALISSEDIPQGNLTFWGPPNNGTTTTGDVVDDTALPQVEKRCGGINVECDDKHEAYTSVCSALIGTLSSAGVSKSPRSICLTQSGTTCCVSWGNEVTGLTQNQLRAAADKSMSTCGSSGLVSAIARDVSLNGVCTNQCLSNRPTDCPGA